MNLKTLQSLATNPWVILVSLATGYAMGYVAPALSLELEFIGNIYVDLLKMIVLPFMVSAIIFSLQRMFRDGGVSKLLARVALVFAAFAVVTALVGTAVLAITQPGANLPQETLQTFGKIVGADINSSDTVMALRGADEPQKKPLSLAEVLVSMIPANIFAALASGETLKALVFALLFGLAASQVPGRLSDALMNTLETVYQSCQLLTRWLNFPLPLVLICMSASQLAKTGVEPLLAMTNFVVVFTLASSLVLIAAVIVLWRRSDRPLSDTLNAMRAPFAVAVATRSSATAMPMMIEALADGLGFARSRVELLVPLATSLLRIGPILYYVCATMFVAQLYGRELGIGEIGLVVMAGILAGFASAGMSGIVTITLTSLACGYLGLPFEAAFILFVAIDPICDMLRTLVLVIGNSAAVSLICARPLKIGG